MFTSVPVTVAIPVALVVVEPVSNEAMSVARIVRLMGVVLVGRVEADDRWASVRISCWLVSDVSCPSSIPNISIAQVAGEAS